jgi:hypothetical protein
VINGLLLPVPVNSDQLRPAPVIRQPRDVLLQQAVLLILIVLA